MCARWLHIIHMANHNRILTALRVQSYRVNTYTSYLDKLSKKLLALNHNHTVSAFLLFIMLLPVAKYLRVTASLTSGEMGILNLDEPMMSSLIVNSSVSKSSTDILVKPAYISESD